MLLVTRLMWRMYVLSGLRLLQTSNVCSQKGLVEMFDGSIGAG